MQFLIDKKEQDYKTLYKQISWTLSSLLISPLDRIRRQLQISEVGTSSGYVIDLIYKQEGVMGFWKNFMYRIFKELYLFNVCEIPEYFKQMKLKNQYLPNLLKTSSQYLLQTLFYPFDIIQARCEIDLGNKQFSGYFDCMIKTYREFGIGGFFVGLKVYTLKFIRGIYSNDKIQISAFYKASIADSILEILFFQQTYVFSDMSSSRNIQKITNLQQCIYNIFFFKNKSMRVSGRQLMLGYKELLLGETMFLFLKLLAKKLV